MIGLLSSVSHHGVAPYTGNGLLDWFTGGSTPYMRLYDCMSGDSLWIAITVVLDLAVAAGYVMIAMHWWKNEKALPPTPAKRALGTMRNIFLFCGICGYLFIPIKMVWPAWRLYDFFMAALVYFTWKYAWNAGNLKVIYQSLGETSKLREALETSQKESKHKTFFLNAISHDLRTPLNGLMLQASLAELGDSNNDPEMLRSALREIKSSARAAGEMLDSFLDYARLDHDGAKKELEIFPLIDALKKVASLHQATATGKSLELIVHAPPSLIVRTDRGKIERVLNNLVGNALKFTERGSVRIEVAHAGDNVEVHVIDTGIGIEHDHRVRLFQEFFQAHNPARDRSKGFGLGLAIARRLANQLGGDIGVESAVGRGSRFTVVLPGIGATNDGVREERPSAAAIATAG